MNQYWFENNDSTHLTKSIRLKVTLPDTHSNEYMITEYPDATAIIFSTFHHENTESGRYHAEMMTKTLVIEYRKVNRIIDRMPCMVCGPHTPRRLPKEKE